MIIQIHIRASGYSRMLFINANIGNKYSSPRWWTRFMDALFLKAENNYVLFIYLLVIM